MKLKRQQRANQASPEPNYTVKHLLLLMALIGILHASVLAQSTEFTYQGKLNDNSAPANGSLSLRG